MLLSYINNIFTSKQKNFLFLKYHFGAILLFGILYWIQDNFVTYYPDISEKYGLGKAYNPPDSFGDWIWFSAITQTTVGYDRLSDGGKRRAFNKIPNRFFKIINFTQICSILILASFMFNN